MVNVFVPTTPNPTSGFLLLVPKSQLKYLNTNIDETVKTIVSAGIIPLMLGRKKISKINLFVKYLNHKNHSL